jgi:hypothetical protein
MEKAAGPMVAKRARMVAVALLPLVGGCLNPNFLNTVVGGFYPTAPGDEPFVMVRVINDTSATLDVPIAYDDGTTPTFTYVIRELTPEGRDTGILLEWPILRIALGDLNNPLLPLIIANFPDGSSSAVPFGQQALVAGVDYDRGDTIIFHITEDSRSAAFLRVSSGLIDGDSQQGSFDRGNPFERLRAVLAASGF